MNPEDPLQFDLLASRLSALQPAAATQLQALTFYEAGKRAASSRPEPALLKLRSLAASLVLVIACSTASFYAGSQRSETLHPNASENLATIAPAQSDSAAPAASIERGPVEHESIEHGFAEQQLASDRRLTHENYYAEKVTPLLLSWFQLPQRSAEEYLQDIEMRTRPPLSPTSSFTQPPHNASSPLDRQLLERDQLQLDSPLRKWLSM